MRRVLIVLLSIVVITLIPLSTKNQVSDGNINLTQPISELSNSAESLKEALIDINSKLEEIK